MSVDKDQPKITTPFTKYLDQQTAGKNPRNTTVFYGNKEHKLIILPTNLSDKPGWALITGLFTGGINNITHCLHKIEMFLNTHILGATDFQKWTKAQLSEYCKNYTTILTNNEKILFQEDPNVRKTLSERIKTAQNYINNDIKPKNIFNKVSQEFGTLGGHTVDKFKTEKITPITILEERLDYISSTLVRLNTIGISDKPPLECIKDMVLLRTEISNLSDKGEIESRHGLLKRELLLLKDDVDTCIKQKLAVAYSDLTKEYGEISKENLSHTQMEEKITNLIEKEAQLKKSVESVIIQVSTGKTRSIETTDIGKYNEFAQAKTDVCTLALKNEYNTLTTRAQTLDKQITGDEATKIQAQLKSLLDDEKTLNTRYESRKEYINVGDVLESMKPFSNSKKELITAIEKRLKRDEKQIETATSTITKRENDNIELNNEKKNLEKEEETESFPKIIMKQTKTVGNELEPVKENIELLKKVKKEDELKQIVSVIKAINILYKLQNNDIDTENAIKQLKILNLKDKKSQSIDFQLVDNNNPLAQLSFLSADINDIISQLEQQCDVLTQKKAHWESERKPITDDINNDYEKINNLKKEINELTKAEDYRERVELLRSVLVGTFKEKVAQSASDSKLFELAFNFSKDKTNKNKDYKEEDYRILNKKFAEVKECKSYQQKERKEKEISTIEHNLKTKKLPDENQKIDFITQFGKELESTQSLTKSLKSIKSSIENTNNQLRTAKPRQSHINIKIEQIQNNKLSIEALNSEVTNLKTDLQTLKSCLNSITQSEPKVLTDSEKTFPKQSENPHMDIPETEPTVQSTQIPIHTKEDLQEAFVKNPKEMWNNWNQLTSNQQDDIKNACANGELSLSNANYEVQLHCAKTMEAKAELFNQLEGDAARVFILENPNTRNIKISDFVKNHPSGQDVIFNIILLKPEMAKHIPDSFLQAPEYKDFQNKLKHQARIDQGISTSLSEKQRQHLKLNEPEPLIEEYE